MNLLEKFNSLDPAKKRQVMIGGILAGIILVSMVFSSTMERKKAQTPRAEKPEVTVVSPERMTGVEQFSAQIEAVSRQLNEMQGVTKHLQNENEELRKQMKKAGESALGFGNMGLLDGEEGTDGGAAANLPVLSAPTILPPPLPAPAPPPAVLPPPADRAAVDVEAAAPARPLVFRMTGEQGAVNENDISKASAPHEPTKEPEHDVYIPSGAMFSGVLLNGMDAPTSSAAQKNPTPVVMRVKREAVLPNFAAIDVRECFLIAAGYGHLSSERAMLRAESLSCVRTDGQVFESKLDAYIVGSDGKVGVPGRLVSKQGQMIAQSLIAGIFSGLGNSMNKTKVPSLNLNPTNGTTLYQAESMESIAQGGVSGGISASAESVAKFYLDMAKESFPVVEVHAGAVGTIIVTRGANLPLKGTTSLKRYIDPNAAQKGGASLVSGGKPAANANPPRPNAAPVNSLVAPMANNTTEEKPNFNNGMGW